ncbi:hypothetical protein L7F22_037336 [Adiantum nelumboides]|nr:hypothetical protein [Adiantum nelumboides]
MVSFLKDKTSATFLQQFRTYQKLVENHLERSIQTLQTDNGGEYTSQAFKAYCAQQGIRHNLTVPHTPQQNGIAERKNCSLMNSARSMLRVAGLPPSFWEEAVSTACYLQNCSYSRSIKGIPYSLWYRKEPDYCSLRIFGCTCYAYIPAPSRNKLDDRALKAIFVGYGEPQSVKDSEKTKSPPSSESTRSTTVTWVAPFDPGAVVPHVPHPLPVPPPLAPAIPLPVPAVQPITPLSNMPSTSRKITRSNHHRRSFTRLNYDTHMPYTRVLSPWDSSGSPSVRTQHLHQPSHTAGPPPCQDTSHQSGPSHVPSKDFHSSSCEAPTSTPISSNSKLHREYDAATSSTSDPPNPPLHVKTRSLAELYNATNPHQPHTDDVSFAGSTMSSEADSSEDGDPVSVEAAISVELEHAAMAKGKRKAGAKGARKQQKATTPHQRLADTETSRDAVEDASSSSIFSAREDTAALSLLNLSLSPRHGNSDKQPADEDHVTDEAVGAKNVSEQLSAPSLVPLDEHNLLIEEKNLILRELNAEKEKSLQISTQIESEKQEREGQLHSMGCENLAALIAKYKELQKSKEESLSSLRDEVLAQKKKYEELSENLKEIVQEDLAMADVDESRRRNVTATPQLRLQPATDEVKHVIAICAKELLSILKTNFNTFLNFAHVDGPAEQTKRTATYEECALQALLCRVFFKDFENLFYEVTGVVTPRFETPSQRKATFFRYFEAWRHEEHVVTLSTDYNFRIFLEKKSSELCMELQIQLLFPDDENVQLRQSDQLSSFLKLSTIRNNSFFDTFIRLGKAVWMLHKVALACQPSAEIFRVGQGSSFDEAFMEDNIHADEADIGEGPKSRSSSHIVKPVRFMCVPGFTQGEQIVVKSRVSCFKVLT